MPLSNLVGEGLRLDVSHDGLEGRPKPGKEVDGPAWAGEKEWLVGPNSAGRGADKAGGWVAVVEGREAAEGRLVDEAR